MVRNPDCSTLPHTIQEICRHFSQQQNRPNLAHEACDMAFRASPIGRALYEMGAGLPATGSSQMDFSSISRRRLLQGSAALTLGTALGARTALAADTTIGFIYVGSRDDYGYNQAHAAGAAVLKKMPGIKVVEEEKVPETDAVEKTMESMINLDGATLLFPTSFGYYN